MDAREFAVLQAAVMETGDARVNHDSDPKYKRVLLDVDLTCPNAPVPRRLEGAFLQVELSATDDPDWPSALLHVLRFADGRVLRYSRRDLGAIGRVDCPPRLLAFGRQALFLHPRRALEITPDAQIMEGNPTLSWAHARLSARSVVVAETRECHLLTLSGEHLVLDQFGRLRRIAPLGLSDQRIVDFGASASSLALVLRHEQGLSVRLHGARTALHAQCWRAPEALAADAELQILNVFEERGVVTLDVLEGSGHGALGVGPQLSRWQLLRGKQFAQRRLLLAGSLRGGVVEPGSVGRRHRFVACASTHVAGNAEPGVVLHDTIEHTTRSYAVGFGRRVSDPLLVAKTPALQRAESYLLALIYDAVRDCSELAVFDTEIASTLPVARVPLPMPVASPLCSLWLSR